jgi:Rrf2 family iron-sulfur cluster assembly transcriptional regulator
MRITTKGRYALRAVANLVISAQEKPKAIKLIAQEEGLSPEFLEQIFFRMKKAGVIDSVRGPGGGFIVRRDPAEISVREVFIAVDEGIDLTPCTSCKDGDESVCDRTDFCVVYDVWKDASDKINEFFANISLHDIVTTPKGKKLIEHLSNFNEHNNSVL